MSDQAEIKIDISGKRLVMEGKVLNISGKSLVLKGSILSNEKNEIVLEGNITEVDGKKTPCWIFKNCPETRREQCPAFPHNGYHCMAIMKTLCKGIMQDKMAEKLANCSRCNFVFGGNHSVLEKYQMKLDKDGNPVLE